ncbi:sodium-dependent transporter [Campylobacter jejuni]|uniref:sodium-dependent transporter n=1 Tax=Campylobacter jejuni TaxID=197 RepID=UPI001121111E|nr:sodium-dependent transporter [Campylobacter jejuni]
MRTYFSKIGFVLAVAGGAVGLGNAWKFPTLSAENGGFVFVLLYLFFTLTIGFSIFLAEVAMGRLSKSDLANAYSNLAIKYGNRWRYGGVFMLGGIFVLSFYLVIMGWVLKYTVVSLYYLPKTLDEAASNFQNLITTNLTSSVFFFILSFFLTLLIVSKGLIKGIEKLNVVIMPSLFLMLVFMLFYCMGFKQGFANAFSYLFYPDFSHFKFSSIAEALGLAFFTLCLGIGCIVTYSSALDKKTNFIKSSVYIVLINLLISFIMGLIVFTFIFEFGADPHTQGAGIYQISRVKALFLIGLFVFVFGICCILSLNLNFFSMFSFFGKDFFTLLDKLTSNFLLPLGAIVCSIFVGFFMNKKQIYKIFSKFISRKIFLIWLFFIRFISPIAIILVMCYQIFV